MPSQHIVSYPISHGTLINISAFVSDEQKAGTPFEGRWFSEVPLEEIEKEYQGFEPAARNLLKASLCAESLTLPSNDEFFPVVSPKSVKMGAPCTK